MMNMNYIMSFRDKDTKRSEMHRKNGYLITGRCNILKSKIIFLTWKRLNTDQKKKNISNVCAFMKGKRNKNSSGKKCLLGNQRNSTFF